MTLNCTDLTLSLWHENTTDVLYLKEDITSCLSTDYLYEPGFELGSYIVIAFVITCSLLCSCIVYPLRLSSAKRITLRILHQKGIMESHLVLPPLDTQTDGQSNISQLIADFAGYHFVDSEDQCVRRVPNTRFEHVSDSAVFFMLCHILTGTLLYCSFIPIYTISRHWSDSYTLFLKTECTFYDSKNMTIVDVHSLCHPNTLEDAEEYTFSLEWDTLKTYGMDSDDMDCYVGTENLKVRSPLHLDLGCCPNAKCCNRNEPRNRCGRCFAREQHSEPSTQCSNCCTIGYCICMVASCLIPCWMLCLKQLFGLMDEKYEFADKYTAELPQTEEEVELMITSRHSNTAEDSKDAL